MTSNSKCLLTGLIQKNYQIFHDGKLATVKMCEECHDNYMKDKPYFDSTGWPKE